MPRTNTLKSEYSQKEKKEISERLRGFGEKHSGVGYGMGVKFAAKLGISTQQLTNYLNGRSVPGNVMQVRLRQLGCDIEWLMTGKTRYEAESKDGKVRETNISFYAPEGMRKKIDAMADEMIDELKRARLGDWKGIKEGLEKILRKHLHE
jgi:transcriptional regulator with XRE-family HTH domain